MLLIFVIIIWDIFFVMNGVSVFIEEKLAKVIVFENVLSVRSKPVIDRDEAFTESVNQPFGLEAQLRNNLHRMFMEFDKSFFRITKSPYGVTFKICIMLRQVI